MQDVEREDIAMRFQIRITDNFLLEPLLNTFGVRRESSFVELTEASLVISMGRWFHETIPLSAISAIAPSDWPWWGGLGVKLGHHGVGVVGAAEGIVNLKLKAPTKVHVVTVVEVEQLWLSMEEPEGFLAALGAATILTVGPHIPF
jgi:hypothetical protein